jgi:hypothetical protein
MTTSLLKKKLTKAISNIDDPDFLQALHTIVLSKNEEIAFELTPSQKKELDRRRANHLNGKSKSYSWDEVRKAALKKAK